MSCVRARGAYVRSDLGELLRVPAFPFPFSPREAFLFPFPRPPISYPASAGFIDIDMWILIIIECYDAWALVCGTAMGWQDDEVTPQAFSTYIMTTEIQHPEAISHTYDFLISADGQSCMWMLHVEQTGHSHSILNNTYQHHPTQV